MGTRKPRKVAEVTGQALSRAEITNCDSSFPAPLSLLKRMCGLQCNRQNTEFPRTASASSIPIACFKHHFILVAILGNYKQKLLHQPILLVSNFYNPSRKVHELLFFLFKYFLGLLAYVFTNRILPCNLGWNVTYYMHKLVSIL